MSLTHDGHVLMPMARKSVLFLLPLVVAWAVPASLKAETFDTWRSSMLMQNTRLRVGASTAFEYRVGMLYQAPERNDFPSWYVGGHLDTVVLSEGFNPVNVGLELGFHLPAAPWLALGLHLEQPLYTDNRLVGVSSTLHSPLVGNRVSGFLNVQLLRYRDPIEGLNGYERQRFFNTLVGVTFHLGTPP